MLRLSCIWISALNESIWFLVVVCRHIVKLFYLHSSFSLTHFYFLILQNCHVSSIVIWNLLPESLILDWINSLVLLFQFQMIFWFFYSERFDASFVVVMAVLVFSIQNLLFFLLGVFLIPSFTFIKITEMTCKTTFHTFSIFCRAAITILYVLGTSTTIAQISFSTYFFGDNLLIFLFFIFLFTQSLVWLLFDWGSVFGELLPMNFFW